MEKQQIKLSLPMMIVSAFPSKATAGLGNISSGGS